MADTERRVVAAKIVSASAWATALAVVLTMAIGAHTSAHEHEEGDKVGEVHFATSCSAAAQTQIDLAVALLHSFQFSRAIAHFDAALERDATCGIADWGAALSDWSNPFAPGIKDTSQLRLGRDHVERALQIGAKTERERGYIAAVGRLYADFESTPQTKRLLAYRDAMRALAARYPDDHEAKIFYALALAASEDPADKTYASRLEAGAILETLFAKEPTHPGLAHYIIHAYDVPALADHALVAARRYARIAPDAPHALHMPSHTFTRLGYWQESIESNIAAAAQARRDGQVSEELHASDYETYAYLQTAQDAAAARIVAALPDMAARFDPKVIVGGAGGPAVGYFALAAIPARYALERRDWQQAERLPLRDTPFAYTDAITLFARGYGAARLGHAASASAAAAALARLQTRLATAGEAYWARQVEIQSLAVAAWADFADGKTQDALKRMEAAADMEDTTEKSAVTPGPLAPARELLGEMLLAMNEPARALQAFDATLAKEPRRFRALYGAAHAAALSGDADASRARFRELASVCANADTPARPELAEAARSARSP